MRWRRTVRGQSGRGWSIRAYCGKHGVKEPAYYGWRAQLARREAARPRATFVAVQGVAEDPAPAAGGQIEILWPGGGPGRGEGQSAAIRRRRA